MAISLDLIKEYVTDAGFDVIHDDGKETFHYYYRMLETTLKIYATVERGGAMLQFYVYPTGLGLAAGRTEALDLLHQTCNEFNQLFYYGRWSVDHEGDPRVSFCFILEDAGFTRRQLARLHHILSDLVIYQAQVLQLESKLETRLNHGVYGLSAVAVRTAVDFPSRLDDIAAALKLDGHATQLLHDVAGKPYAESVEPNSTAGSNNHMH